MTIKYLGLICGCNVRIHPVQVANQLSTSLAKGFINVTATHGPRIERNSILCYSDAIKQYSIPHSRVFLIHNMAVYTTHSPTSKFR